jgi:hypothetical protein
MQLDQVRDVDSLSLGTNYWACPRSRIASPVAHNVCLQSQFGQPLGSTAPISRNIPFVHERKATADTEAPITIIPFLSRYEFCNTAQRIAFRSDPHSVLELQSEQTKCISQRPGRKDRLRSSKVESRGRPSSPRDHSRHRSNPLADRAESAAAPPRAFLEHPPRSPH